MDSSGSAGVLLGCESSLISEILRMERKMSQRLNTHICFLGLWWISCAVQTQDIRARAWSTLSSMLQKHTQLCGLQGNLGKETPPPLPRQSSLNHVLYKPFLHSLVIHPTSMPRAPVQYSHCLHTAPLPVRGVKQLCNAMTQMWERQRKACRLCLGSRTISKLKLAPLILTCPVSLCLVLVLISDSQQRPFKPPGLSYTGQPHSKKKMIWTEESMELLFRKPKSEPLG